MRHSSLAIILISLLVAGCRSNTIYSGQCGTGCAGCQWTGFGDYGCAWTLNHQFTKAPPGRPGQYGLGACRPWGSLRWCGYCGGIENGFFPGTDHSCPSCHPECETGGHGGMYDHAGTSTYTTQAAETKTQPDDWTDGYVAGLAAAEKSRRTLGPVPVSASRVVELEDSGRVTNASGRGY